MTIALYPGTFDPMHNGHVDVAKRAAELFERLIVAVSSGEGVKEPLFAVQERIGLAQAALGTIANITVQGYAGLTIHFARQVGATVMVRGIRTGADLDVELPLAHMNGSVAPAIQTIFLPTSPQYAFVSATLLKQLVRGGSDVAHLVSPDTAAALQKRMG